MHTSFIKKAAVFGLALASTSLFAEATYSPHKYQQNDWFAEFGGNTSMYVNPAGISETEQLEFSAAFFSSISGEASQEYVSLTFPMDYKHTLGFSFFENGASIDDGPSYGEYAFMFGYAYNLMQFLALGVDISVLYINQFDEVKQLTLGADVGVSWNPLASSKYGYLLVGVALQNALQPAVSTAVEEDGMKFVLFTESEAYKIPSNLNISFFYRGLNRALEAKVELSIIDVMHESSEGGEGMNLEQSFTLTYYLSPHLGVRARFTKECYPVVGATVNVKDVSIFRYLALDYLLSWCLLRKDLDRFVECIGMVDTPALPKSYQEALLLRWVLTHNDFEGLPTYLFRTHVQRIGQFIQDFQAGKSEDYMYRQYGDTYWFYYYYRQDSAL